MSSGRLLWILFAVPMLMLLGCTRPEGDTSTIKIVVPQAMRSTKNASQAPSSSDKLAHVIINVTGDGIAQPILVVWDGHDDGSVAPPPAFSLSIPMGSNRLFQVLAVYKDSTTNIMSFYYGDQVKTLSQASESVTIPISSFSSGAISGSVFGRYLDTANSGPSGVVEMRFDPGNGKPPLLIERSLILNGWFNVFMLTGTPFQYVLDSGRVLFGGAVSLDDPRFKPAANDPHALRVTFPAHQRNNSQTWQGEEAEIFVYGWFADPAQAPSLAGKAVCRPNTYGVLSKMAKYDNPATFLTGMLDSAIPANDALLKTDASSIPQYFINGGVDATANANCITPNVRYENFLAFAPSMVDGNGKDGAMPFDVPFAKDGSGNVFNISTGAANRVIQMQILPGLVTPIESVKIFKKVSTDEIHSDSMNCLDVAAGIGGFVESGSATPNANGTVSVSTNITSAEATSGVSAAVCSVIGGKLFPIGVLINKWHFGSSGGGMAGPPTQIKITLQGVASSIDPINRSACVPAKVELLDSGNMVTQATSSGSITVTLGVNAGTIPTDGGVSLSSDCTALASSQVVSFNSGDWGRKNVYVKISGGTPTSGGLTDTATGGLAGLTTLPANFVIQNSSVAPGTAQMAFVWADDLTTVTSPKAYQCRQVFAQFQDSMGRPIPPPSTASAALNTDTGVFFYASYDGNCGGATMSGIQSMSNTNNPFNLFISSTAAGYMGFTSATGGSGQLTSSTYTFPLSVPMPSAPVLLEVRLQDPQLNNNLIARGPCVPVHVEAYDSSGAPTDQHSGITFSLSDASLGTFYADPSCTGVATGADFSIPVGVGNYKKDLYYRVNSGSSGPLNVSVTGTSPAMASGTNRNFVGTIQPLKFDFTSSSISAAAGGCFTGINGRIIVDDGGSTLYSPAGFYPQAVVSASNVPASPAYASAQGSVLNAGCSVAGVPSASGMFSFGFSNMIGSGTITGLYMIEDPASAPALGINPSTNTFTITDTY